MEYSSFIPLGKLDQLGGQIFPIDNFPSSKYSILPSFFIFPLYKFNHPFVWDKLELIAWDRFDDILEKTEREIEFASSRFSVHEPKNIYVKEEPLLLRQACFFENSMISF